MTSDSYSAGFGGLGIAPGLLQAIARLNCTEPTPVQRRTIPVGLEGKDLIAIAQTGTGKTLAFGIPLIQRLAHLKGRGLVLLPTRELAIQVSESLHAVGKSVGFRTAVVIGGAPEGQQKQALMKNPRVIIATPGRLVDFLEQRVLNISDVEILDIKSNLLEFYDQGNIKRIIGSISKQEIMNVASITGFGWEEVERILLEITR